MRTLLKVFGLVVVTCVALALSGAAAIYGFSSRKIARTYPVPTVTLTVPDDETAIARGQHLVTSMTACQECHGLDLGGSVMIDEPPLGYVAAANLTPGRGGVGASFTVEDWVRAIRHGVRRDGRSLFIMPSESYANLSDHDLAAMIAYLRQVPPVDREWPAPRVGPLGRALLVAGQLDFLVAEKTPTLVNRPALAHEPSVEYGAYLANIGGCTSCHGPDLTGGLAAGPPGSPVSTNLTPAVLGSWSEADFVRALREGKRPDGTDINEVMPWRFSGKMMDDELHALWLYLQSVPAKATEPR